MALEFQTLFINFPAYNPAGDTEAKDFFGEVRFSKAVKKAETMLNGFNLNFINGGHNTLRMLLII